MLKKKTVEKSESVKVYEVGYHFVPTLSPEQVEVEVENLKKYLTKSEAVVISEAAPVETTLAYMMAKQTGGVRGKFTTSFFGWVKFELSPAKVAPLKKFLDETDHILRYLLIETVRENTLATEKLAHLLKKDDELETKVVGDVKGVDQAAKPKVDEVKDEVELDKTITKLALD